MVTFPLLTDCVDGPIEWVLPLGIDGGTAAVGGGARRDGELRLFVMTSLAVIAVVFVFGLLLAAT